MPSAVWANELWNPHRSQIIHPQLLALCDSYQTAYKAKYKNRNLQILSFLGSVTLACERGRLELTVSTLQATILLHFNTHSELPIKKLKEDLLKDTILDDDLFTQLLTPLVS
jgi:hypothetical protein